MGRRPVLGPGETGPGWVTVAAAFIVAATILACATAGAIEFVCSGNAEAAKAIAERQAAIAAMRHRVTLGDRVWIARGRVWETAIFAHCYAFIDDATGLRVDVAGQITIERIE